MNHVSAAIVLISVAFSATSCVVRTYPEHARYHHHHEHRHEHRDVVIVHHD